MSGNPGRLNAAGFDIDEAETRARAGGADLADDVLSLCNIVRKLLDGREADQHDAWVVGDAYAVLLAGLQRIQVDTTTTPEEHRAIATAAIDRSVEILDGGADPLVQVFRTLREPSTSAGDARVLRLAKKIGCRDGD